MPSSSAKKISLATNEYNFSLLADPNKIKEASKTVIVKNSNLFNNEESDSKSNLIDVNDPESDINFNDKSSVSSTTSKIIKVSKSSTSSNRRARHESIHHDITSYKKETKTEKKAEIKNDKKDDIKEDKPEDIKYNKKEETVKTDEKTPGGIYIADYDNYDTLDDTQKRIRRMEKFAILTHLKADCNCKLSKPFSMNSDYWEMCAEIKYHTDKTNKEHGVTAAKKGLAWAAWAFEFMNDKYDPFGVNLKGWSDHVELTKDNYTEVFEELYEKYKGSGRKIEPEMKLLFGLGFSAMTFHATKTAAKIPGLEDVIAKNPELAAKLEAAISKKMMSTVHQKSQEELQKEAEYKAYQQMMATKQKEKEVEKQVQNNTQKPNNFVGANEIQSTNIGSKFTTGISNQQHKILEDVIAQQPIIKPPNMANILNRVKNTTNNKTLVHESIENESDTTPIISSVKKNARVEITETLNLLNSESISSNLDSIKSEDIQIKRISKKRKSIQL